jgi:hypothetical protein
MNRRLLLRSGQNVGFLKAEVCCETFTNFGFGVVLTSQGFSILLQRAGLEQQLLFVRWLIAIWLKLFFSGLKSIFELIFRVWLLTLASDQGPQL